MHVTVIYPDGVIGYTYLMDGEDLHLDKRWETDHVEEMGRGIAVYARTRSKKK